MARTNRWVRAVGPTEITCAVPDCEFVVREFGLCTRHYSRHNKGMKLDAPFRKQHRRPQPGERFGNLEIVEVFLKELIHNNVSRFKVRCWCHFHNGKTMLGLVDPYCLNHGTCTFIQSDDFGQFSGLNRAYTTHKHTAKVCDRSSCDREIFFEISQSVCAYCGAAPSQRIYRRPESEAKYLANSVDRIDSRRGYEADNVQPLCITCNDIKGQVERTIFSGSTIMGSGSHALSDRERAIIAIKALTQYGYLNPKDTQVHEKPVSDTRPSSDDDGAIIDSTSVLRHDPVQ